MASYMPTRQTISSLGQFAPKEDDRRRKQVATSAGSEDESSYVPSLPGVDACSIKCNPQVNIAQGEIGKTSEKVGKLEDEGELGALATESLALVRHKHRPFKPLGSPPEEGNHETSHLRCTTCSLLPSGVPQPPCKGKSLSHLIPAPLSPSSPTLSTTHGDSVTLQEPFLPADVPNPVPANTSTSKDPVSDVCGVLVEGHGGLLSTDLEPTASLPGGAAHLPASGKRQTVVRIKDADTDSESSSTCSTCSGSSASGPPSPSHAPSLASEGLSSLSTTTTVSAASTSSDVSPSGPARGRLEVTKMFLPHESSELEMDEDRDVRPDPGAAAAAAARATAAKLLKIHRDLTPSPPCAEHVRVHPLSLQELALVDESPAHLTSPRLSSPFTQGQVLSCRTGFGKAGRGKAYRGPARQVKGPLVLYGEDVLAEAELVLPPGEDRGGEGRPQWVRVMGVFDGHGLHGKEAARMAAEMFLRDMRRTTMQTLEALLAGDVGGVRRVEEERYRCLEEYLEKELQSPTGGTTGSTVQLLALTGKVFGVVSNVGDSPVLLVETRTGRVQVLTGRHAWDNPEERQRYLARCARMGVMPREVVYGRINCGGMRMTDRNGTQEPLLMYKPGSSEVCTETRDWLCEQVEKRYRNSIGGSQSIRRMVLERLKAGEEEGGEWEVFKALEGHGHMNWGATVLVNGEGKIQMTRSLGDRQEKRAAYIWAEPDVAVFEVGPGEDWTVVACSDGVGDMWYFHELGALATAFFAKKDEAGGEGGEGGGAQLILEETIERGEVTPGYGVAPRVFSVVRGEGLKRPLWDDLSVHCARIQT
ncbi:hypothetical protein NGA_0170700 [Nannochloropsis gaditana CCMP526]|uniref:uncharacterized protein n=1 Tax=Nannochloropsis gaditana (strain CCMP526) TaxID=1093141 RepID=UPI00029F5C4F|nr:hypothetical protein NGA_0170700 [Nannochloropsis gaditana CCMP526]EKU22197.1 hypothetical protein NGA_0170700 [Nannochloropsis gaditana CCMP526]|eukprot:XP_005854164.1 hypothetical protein NGA_0170700 [Nannochloropsis gaditana CCMP526]